MVEIGSGAQREIADVRLSRYACYLIVQNGDSAKPTITSGQTNFAVQSQRQMLGIKQVTWNKNVIDIDARKSGMFACL
jgi:hypothetical protein